MPIWIARILSLAWAAWWLFFAVASGIAEGSSTSGVIMHALLGPPAVAFLVVAILAWRWERLGGVLLVATGIGMGIAHYTMAHGRFLVATLLLAIPPLIAGLLFLIVALKSRAAETGKSPIEA
jgi:hypothetical protein